MVLPGGKEYANRKDKFLVRADALPRVERHGESSNIPIMEILEQILFLALARVNLQH
jgi:hypothetical protein